MSGTKLRFKRGRTEASKGPAEEGSIGKAAIITRNHHVVPIVTTVRPVVNGHEAAPADNLAGP